MLNAGGVGKSRRFVPKSVAMATILELSENVKRIIRLISTTLKIW